MGKEIDSSRMGEQSASSTEMVLPQKVDQVIGAGRKLFEMVASSVTKEVTTAMTAISGVAEKGTIIFLQTFGAALIIFCLTLKVEIHHQSLSKLTNSEYIVTITAALVFILAGTGMRFYILRHALETQKLMNQTGQEIMKSQAAAANKEIERTGETARAMATEQPDVPPGT